MATKNQYSRYAKKKLMSRKKKTQSVLATIILAVIFGGLWLYDNGHLDRFFENKIVADTGLVVLQPGTEVAASPEAEACGYENYTWLGYSEAERAKADCLIDSLVVSSDISNEPKYERDEHFGPSWQYDYDSSGCNTRDDILNQVLTAADVNKCTVFRGIYPYDPYTGEKDVVWSKDDSASLQVDHIVALKDSWVSGAKSFSAADEITRGIAHDPYERRQQIANDPLNLVLADGPENQSKSASKADEWMIPLNEGYRCEYSVRQIMVKDKYDLMVTKDEHRALAKQLELCKP